jgi:hypothetical protein
VDRDLFADRLAAAAHRALDVARPQVLEDLPDKLIFRLRLNQSYDAGDPTPAERRFPGDGSRAAALSRCDHTTAVTELWRDGWSPEWINIAVTGVTATATLIEAVCCGRFVHDGDDPFRVQGPVLPADHDGSRFSLHTRAECWSPADLADLTAAAGRVWSLDMHIGDDLPGLPALEILTHAAYPRPDLSDVARFPRLRCLRLHVNDRFQAAGVPLDEVHEVTLQGLPPRPWHHRMLATLTPNATTVNLGAPTALWLDDVWSPAVRRITLTADGLYGTPRLPDHLDYVGLHLPERDVESLLRPLRRLHGLSLRHAPVTDAVIDSLATLGLTSLDVVGTRITREALHAFQTAHPTMGILPRVSPPEPALTDYHGAAARLRRSVSVPSGGDRHSSLGAGPEHHRADREAGDQQTG